MDIILLYLLMQSDTIRSSFHGMCWISGIVMLCSMAAAAMSSDLGCNAATKTWVKRAFLWAFAAFLLSFSTYALWPSTRSLAVIAGGHLALEAAKSETGKKIGGMITDLLNDGVAELKNREKK